MKTQELINKELERINNTKIDYAKEHRLEGIREYQESIVDRIGGQEEYEKAIEGFFLKSEDTKDGEEIVFTEKEEMIANHLLVLPKGDTYDDGYKSAIDSKNTIKEYGMKYAETFAVYSEDGKTITKGGSIHSLDYQRGYYNGILEIIN